MATGSTENLKDEIEKCLLRRDTGKAKILAEELRRLLIVMDNDYTISEEGKKFWHDLLVRLQLQALALFSEEEIAEMFKKNLLEMLSDQEIDLYERFNAKQIVMPYELMEDFLILLLEAIHENEQTIGQNGIFIPGEVAAVDPTVRNWLLDYDRTYGTEAQEDVVLIDYVAQSRNTSTLNAEDKSMLRKVLKFYEFLKPEYIYEE